MIIEIRKDNMIITRCHIWDLIIRTMMSGGVILAMKYGIEDLKLLVDGHEIPQPEEWGEP